MWIRRLRHERKLSQSELASRLQLEGIDVGPGAIGHWENERNRPPIENPRFATALAAALEIDMTEMMVMAGYEISKPEEEIAVRAAVIISHLPPAVQTHALEYLLLLERQHRRERVPTP